MIFVMPEDLIVDVPDELEALLSARARRNGRTLEDEHRAILLEALEPYIEKRGETPQT